MIAGICNKAIKRQLQTKMQLSMTELALNLNKKVRDFSALISGLNGSSRVIRHLNIMSNINPIFL